MLNFEKGAVPLYVQLEKILRREIEEEKFMKGDIFPSEKELIEKYGVSRMTVREALSILAKDGYVKGARGIGTLVTYEKINEHAEAVISFTEEMQRHGVAMKTILCKIEKIVPDIRISKILQIPLESECYCLTRLRCVEGSPFVYTVSYLNPIEKFSLDPDTYRESLYQYLRNTFQIEIKRGKDTFEAAVPSPEVRELLKMDEGTPVLKRSRMTYLKQDVVLEYSICYYPGNKYQYTVEL